MRALNNTFSILLSGNSEDYKISVGDHVRVKASVSNPRYAWGEITRKSVGVVKRIDSDGDVTVDFLEQKGWKGYITEMEIVSSEYY